MRELILQANEATYAAWNAHDPDAVSAVFADGGEIVDVTSGVTTKGRAAIRTLAAARFGGFPDFTLERKMLLIDCNKNADQWLMHGTHTGDYMGLAATGRAVEVQGATFSEFDEHALVVRDMHYIDVPALLRQLGLD